MTRSMMIAAIAALVTTTAATPAAPERDAGTLRASAAKVDITPVAADLPAFYTVWATRYEGVHDPIYARALVIDDGHSKAALIATDLVELGDMTALRQRIQGETGIPADHLMITASHDHGAPRAGPVTPGNSSARGRPYSPPAYIAMVNDRIVAAVRAAQAALRPAQVGVGTGRADVNVNRLGYDGHRWGSPDLSRPSDKTVWSVKFADRSGAAIAILFNYGIHSVVAGPDSRLVTGDLAGAAERAVEAHYGGKAVALWTLGPAGDQNPRYMADASTRGDGPDFGWRAMDAQGLVVGVETFHAADAITAMTDHPRLTAGQSSFTCAALPAPNPAARADKAPAAFPPNPDFHQTIPAPNRYAIQLSAIRIGDIALVGVGGEVFTPIYQHLQKRSPLAATIMVTMTNDRIGYIADDADYDGPYRNAQIERGCAEAGIVDGLVKLIG